MQPLDKIKGFLLKRVVRGPSSGNFENLPDQKLNFRPFWGLKYVILPILMPAEGRRPPPLKRHCPLPNPPPSHPRNSLKHYFRYYYTPRADSFNDLFSLHQNAAFQKRTFCANTYVLGFHASVKQKEWKLNRKTTACGGQNATFDKKNFSFINNSWIALHFSSFQLIYR